MDNFLQAMLRRRPPTITLKLWETTTAFVVAIIFAFLQGATWP
jgi:hypothetical protein